MKDNKAEEKGFKIKKGPAGVSKSDVVLENAEKMGIKVETIEIPTPKAMNEFKFKALIKVKSIRGITLKEAFEGVLEMEVLANAKGDPRFYIQLLEIPEENFYVES